MSFKTNLWVLMYFCITEQKYKIQTFPTSYRLHYNLCESPTRGHKIQGDQKTGFRRSF